jgi:hypothetical protein
VGNPEGKRLLGRPRCRWVNNIKIDVREIEWAGMDWINLPQDRGQCSALVNTYLAEDKDQWRALVNTEPSGSLKCWEILE